MSNPASGEGLTPEGTGGTVQYHKRDFWSRENLKFSEPWYRLEKTARLISRLAGGRACALLDVGCGPAALARMLPPSIEYYGIDIAIHNPAPNLIESDILESPIAFNGRKFDLVVAQGVFEYVGEFQVQKFSEIAALLNPGGRFLTTYTNFGHRKRYIYPAFSKLQPLDRFHSDLSRYFDVDRSFPVSYNWKHGHPSRKLLRAANMPLNMNIPVIGPTLAVEYYFICSTRASGIQSQPT
jgi:SAM-dependent methyltransferase